MEKTVSGAIGSLLVFLASTGFIKRHKHLMGLMNVDTNHSMLRIPISALMYYASSSASSLKNTRSLLLGGGLLYVLIGGAGLLDRRIKGFLPSGLTKFDYAYHFGTGAVMIYLGSRKGRMLKAS